MRKFFLLYLLLITVTVAGPMPSGVLAQAGAPPIRVVTVTPQGIAFFERTLAGTLEAIGEPLGDFAVESYGGSAEWMILGSESFAVSPDGQRIAFTARRGSEAALFLYIINDESLLQHPIVSYWLLPTWSPDSGAILLNLGARYEDELPHPNAYVYEVASDFLFQITFSEGFVDVWWSADGDSLLYLGSCRPDPCGNPTRDLYLVSRDGADRFPLTDFPTQLPSDVEISACHLAWSPNNQRWYYEVGCGTFHDTPFTFIYSVDLNGNNRLELDLEDYVRSTDGAGITFQYAGVRGIHPRPEGTYLSVQVEFYPDEDLHPELPVATIDELRVLRLTDQGQIETLYQQPISSIGPAGLTGSVISPDGQRMAMLFNFDSAYIVDIANNQNIRAIPGLTPPAREAVCDVRWIDNNIVAYNVGARICDIVTQTTPQDAHIMDVTTGAVTSLTDTLPDPAWVLPIPEAEVLAQLPPTPTPTPTPSDTPTFTPTFTPTNTPTPTFTPTHTPTNTPTHTPTNTPTRTPTPTFTPTFTPSNTPLPAVGTVQLAGVPASILLTSNWTQYSLTLSQPPLPSNGVVTIQISLAGVGPSSGVEFQLQPPGGSWSGSFPISTTFNITQANWNQPFNIRIRAFGGGDPGRIVHRVIVASPSTPAATNYPVNTIDAATGRRLTGAFWTGSNDTGAAADSRNVILFTLP